ncbi:HPP family protein [Bacillus halotolerans]
MQGKGKTPLQVNGKDAVTGFLGGFITILALAVLTSYTSSPWLMAPFGASCVLVFSAWNAPLSQPRNVIGGHFISALTGLAVLHIFGAHLWTFALGTGLAIFFMMLTKTTHPPAGADPIVVIQGAYAWSYLLFPVFIGSAIIVIIALVINNLRKNRQYPSFWL